MFTALYNCNMDLVWPSNTRERCAKSEISDPTPTQTMEVKSRLERTHKALKLWNVPVPERLIVTSNIVEIIIILTL